MPSSGVDGIESIVAKVEEVLLITQSKEARLLTLLLVPAGSYTEFGKQPHVAGLAVQVVSIAFKAVTMLYSPNGNFSTGSVPGGVKAGAL